MGDVIDVAIIVGNLADETRLKPTVASIVFMVDKCYAIGSCLTGIGTTGQLSLPIDNIVSRVVNIGLHQTRRVSRCLGVDNQYISIAMDVVFFSSENKDVKIP